MLFRSPTSVVHELLTGRQILAILEQSATNLRPAHELDRVGGLIQTAGLRWTVDLRKQAGHRISDVHVGERALDDSAHYRVITNGGLLQGTHRQTTFAEGNDIVRDPRSFGAVFEEGARMLGIIHSPRLGAVTLIK